ncbi:MAG TPA: nuclear transport factor 2 family protein [Bryobacteraceae bacterium]|nr:nuclear transport factor 2 family protein [Bryobacteraceae bacterium]
MRAFVLVVLIAVCSACSDFRAMDARGVREQIDHYAASIDAADAGLGAQIWSTSDDVSFISPMGHAHGWKEVQGIYQFFGTNFTDRKLAPRNVSIHVNGDSAWAEFYWHFHAKSVKDGSAVETDGRETQIYNWIGGRWRLVHVHYSGPAQPAS